MLPIDARWLVQAGLTLVVVVGGLKAGLAGLESRFGDLREDVAKGFKAVDDRCASIEAKVDRVSEDLHTRVTRNAEKIARVDERTRSRSE